MMMILLSAPMKRICMILILVIVFKTMMVVSGTGLRNIQLGEGRRSIIHGTRNIYEEERASPLRPRRRKQSAASIGDDGSRTDNDVIDILLFKARNGVTSSAFYPRRKLLEETSSTSSLHPHRTRRDNNLFGSTDDGSSQSPISLLDDDRTSNIDDSNGENAGEKLRSFNIFNDEVKTVEEIFVKGCKTSLLSSPTTNDEIISQIDYTTMLLYQCQFDNLCPPNYQLTFDRLPVALQKDFIDGVCPMDDRFECITGLYEMWVDTGLFGFRADDPDIGDLVPNMCISTYSDAVDSGFAKSAAPTSSPLTEQPTFDSTDPPTSKRTRRPSPPPSSMTYPPLMAPTMKPTNPPSTVSQPTKKPLTKRPTFIRTRRPTFIRTNKPSLQTSGPLFDSPRPSNTVSGRPSITTSAPSSAISFVPSTLPSTQRDEPSHHPSTSSQPSYTALPSLVPSVSTEPTLSLSPTTTPSEEPSHTPSVSLQPTITSLPSTAPTSDGPISTGAMIGIGMSCAILLLLLLLAARIVYVRHHPAAGRLGAMPVKEFYSFREPHHFDATAHEPWGKHIPSLPMSYMGFNYSSGSSSSSFRDYRFVAVFSSDGKPIPQFNPNTAGAVVIGNVTIGGASSSLGSGPFLPNTGSSSNKSRSFFSLGTISRRNESPTSEGGISSKDDMSSLSSRRSSSKKKKVNVNSNRTRWRDGHVRVTKSRPPIGGSESSRSETSHNTVPLGHRKQQTIVGRVDCDGVSFGDWLAVSNMSGFRHPGLPVTDTAALLSQRKVFFNVLCPEVVQSSECQSLPNMYGANHVGLFDTGSSSLSESFYSALQESQLDLTSSALRQKSTTVSIESKSASQFVPWRKAGFSPSLQLSDSRLSESESSAGETIIPVSSKRRDVFRPAKAAFTRYKKKSSVKDWFSFKKRNRQYHHLHRDVSMQEDTDVLSMNSYSSQMNLLPIEAITRAELPNLVLGTFAAATMPTGNQQFASLKLDTTQASENSDELEGWVVTPLTRGTQFEPFAAALPSSTVTTTSIHISSLDVESNFQASENSDELEEWVVSPSSIRGTQFEQFAAVVPSSKVTAVDPQISIHISSLDVDSNLNETDSSSFEAYSKSDFDSSTSSPSIPPLSSAPSKNADDRSGSISSSSSSSYDTSQSSRHLLTTGSFAAAISPLVTIVEPPNETTILSATDCVDSTAATDDNNNQLDLNKTHIVSCSGSDSDSENTHEQTVDGIEDSESLVVTQLIATEKLFHTLDEGVHLIVDDGVMNDVDHAVLNC